MSRQIRKETRDKIVAQAMQEVQHAQWAKRKRVQDWHLNEDVLFEKKPWERNEARSMVSLHKARGFVSTILSKIDSPLAMEFQASHTGDTERAKLANAIKEVDAEKGNWEFKDLLGKEQCLIYGRSINSYHAKSDDGYTSEYTPIDVYDFLIDPNVGGLDINDARYCGHYGVRLHSEDIKAGAKSGKYIKEEAKYFYNGQSVQRSEEEEDKENRRTLSEGNNTEQRQSYIDDEIHVFHNWYTTYNNERYYLLLSMEHGTAIRIMKLEEITESGMWPYWSYAAFPSLTEFWSQSFMDIARDIILAQNITINQMLDNAEMVNKPMRGIVADDVVDKSELRYRRHGTVRFRKGVNIQASYQIMETPAIETPLATYDQLEGILEKMSGVTSAVQGIGEEERVAIYEGNVAQAADRFNLLNRSYANGYKRFAELYMWGLREHLNDKVSVKFVGPKGVEVHSVSYPDIKPFEDYEIMVTSSASESEADAKAKRDKLTFLQSLLGSGLINDENAFEELARNTGFNEQEIKKLMDIENTTSQKMMSELDRDIEMLIRGKEVKPNINADEYYLKGLQEYINDQAENLKPKQNKALKDYFEAVFPEVQRNVAAKLEQERIDAQNEALGGQEFDEEGNPLPPQEDQLADQPLQDTQFVEDGI